MIIRLFLALSLAGLVCTGTARAQCLTLQSQTIPSPYNPFTGTAVQQGLILTALKTGDSDDANVVLLRQPGDDRAFDLVIQSDDGGAGGTSMVYYPPGPTLSHKKNDPGELELNFKNQNARTAHVLFSAPANSDVPAGTLEVVFDVKYKCEKKDVEGVTPAGFILRLTVLSALQASFVGTALDFGEIGKFTNEEIDGAPDSIKRVTSALRVASSGPYEILAESQNGWVMTPSGGPATLPNEKIGYELRLVGNMARPGSNFTKKTCARAGTAGVFLPMSVMLLEGGAGKTPSPVYQDVVTVTVTPLGATTPAPESCP